MNKQVETPSKVDEWATGSSTYQLFILGLSIGAVLGWIGIFVVPLFFPVSDDTIKILLAADTLVSFIFLYDFFRRLHAISNRAEYLKWGWIDLVSSIPWFPVLRIARVFYIFRVRTYLKTTSGKKIFATFREKRAETALLGTVFALFLLLLIGSILILQFEADAPGAEIIDGQDAVYWSIVTLTTVGYGDLVPVTGSGQLVAIVIMTAGVGLVGVLSGYLVNYFTPKRDDPIEKLTQIEEELAEIKQMLAAIQPQQTDSPDKYPEGD